MDSTISSTSSQAEAVQVLPTMTITSRTPVPSDKTWVAGTVSIVDGGRTILSGNLQIKLRGNFTATLPKKPYKIKLENKAKLFDMSNDKDWALMANALDKTLTSTALATRVGQASTASYALPWTPKSIFVDLTLNGTYLTFNGERVNGPEVKGDTGLSSTGTYLMEINHQGGTYDYTSPRDVTINFDNPDREIITAPQANYISNFLTTFENSLFQGNNSWKQMINLLSFATWYIIEELASNQDSAFSGSCKCYKLLDTVSTVGKFFMGPIWDFDISFGNTVNEPHAPNVFYVRDPAGH
ncbi:MAG: hypothetical protein MMC33_009568 [Icmadophila ericetorum]|nr:hypothetical protein [Icmadophila ericetorum]